MIFWNCHKMMYFYMYIQPTVPESCLSGTIVKYMICLFYLSDCFQTKACCQTYILFCEFSCISHANNSFCNIRFYPLLHSLLYSLLYPLLPSFSYQFFWFQFQNFSTHSFLQHCSENIIKYSIICHAAFLSWLLCIVRFCILKVCVLVYFDHVFGCILNFRHSSFRELYLLCKVCCIFYHLLCTLFPYILSDIIYTFYILSVSLLQKTNITGNTLTPGGLLLR